MAKKGVNGKQKGNGFERTIANLLSKRFSEHLGVEQGFRRNPDSGSFFGGSNIKRTETHDTDYAVYGDLICPRSFRFSIECKNYKKPPTLNALAKQSIAEWDEWIKQANQDATVGNKDMLLIVKYNYTEILAMTNDQLPGITPFAQYKDKYVYTLDDVLTLDTSYFFTQA